MPISPYIEPASISGSIFFLLGSELLGKCAPEPLVRVLHSWHARCCKAKANLGAKTSKGYAKVCSGLQDKSCRD